MLLRLHNDLLICIEKINEPYQRQNFAEIKWYPEMIGKLMSHIGLNSDLGSGAVYERASRN